jgi:hypothetical protein
MAEPTIQFADPGGKGVVFSGPPKMLRGDVRVMNTGNQKLKMTSLPVMTETLLGPAALPLQNLTVGARLQPGEQAAVKSTIQLDSRTPPGTYEFKVDIGGMTVPATAHVTEVVDFRMEPAAVTLLAGAETSFEKTFVIENAGNVPLPIGERCEAPLIDSIDLKTSMLRGLHSAVDGELKEKLNSWLTDWGERSPGTLVVLRDPIVLSPGNKIAVKAVFELPQDLEPYRCYTADLQLYNASLSVTIYTTRKAASANKKK